MSDYDPRSLRSSEWLTTRLFPLVVKDRTIAEVMEVGYLPKTFQAAEVGVVLLLEAADGVAWVHVARITDTGLPVLAFVQMGGEQPAAPTTRKRAA